MSAIMHQLGEELSSATGHVLLGLFGRSIFARAPRGGGLRERGVSGRCQGSSSAADIGVQGLRGVVRVR